MPKVGDKNQVWVGAAEHTPGGLTRDDLMMNKRGKVVSKRKHALGLSQAHNLTARRGGAATYFQDNQGSGILGDILPFGHMLGLGAEEAPQGAGILGDIIPFGHMLGLGAKKKRAARAPRHRRS